MILAAVLALHWAGEVPSTPVQRSVQLQIESQRPDSLAERILLRGRATGGWLSYRDDHSLTLKVPTDSLERLQRWVGSLGRRLDVASTAEDRSERITQLVVSIAAEDSLLRSYRELVESADYRQLRDVERMAANLALETERLRADLGQELSKTRWGTLQVRLGLLGGTTAGSAPTSPFEWIRSTTPESLLGEAP